MCPTASHFGGAGWRGSGPAALNDRSPRHAYPWQGAEGCARSKVPALASRAFGVGRASASLHFTQDEPSSLERATNLRLLTLGFTNLACRWRLGALSEGDGKVLYRSKMGITTASEYVAFYMEDAGKPFVECRVTVEALDNRTSRSGQRIGEELHTRFNFFRTEI